jgi:hypothetical protein
MPPLAPVSLWAVRMAGTKLICELMLQCRQSKLICELMLCGQQCCGDTHLQTGCRVAPSSMSSSWLSCIQMVTHEWVWERRGG